MTALSMRDYILERNERGIAPSEHELCVLAEHSTPNPFLSESAKSALSRLPQSTPYAGREMIQRCIGAKPFGLWSHARR